MARLRNWFSRGLAVLAFALALAACGAAGRLLSDVESAALVGGQSGTSWCRWCRECNGTNTECLDEPGNTFCQQVGYLGDACPPYFTSQFYIPQDCDPTMGDEYCSPGPSKRCSCRVNTSCNCNVLLPGQSTLYCMNNESQFFYTLVPRYYSYCICDTTYAGVQSAYACNGQ